MLSGKNLEERLIIQNSCTAYDVFTRIDGQAMSYDTDYFNQEEIDFLNFIAKATRSNQLFLINAVQLNMVKLRPLYGKLFKTPISERWGKQICLNE